MNLCQILLTVVAVILTQNSKTNDFNYNYTDPNYGHELGRHRIYYRVDWGGKPPKLGTKLLEHPVSLVIISHTLTLPCLSNVTCSSILRTIQTKHFAKPFLSADIGYNFLIGRDGGIYVGRGWDVRNFHRKISIGISFIGNFNFDEVNEEMIEAAEALIGQGLELRKISENYALVGENQTDPKMVISPGVNVYKVIRTWPRFYPKTMF
ncbi:hypothetical protein NQ315_000927 [Exocentrus adspersus]|uniref:Peptidoglycan-recognition protein n=1 Tax=Exocentrus adspersus TaxID=1586481 RepID=A0AAV8WDS6_9CUCU|nr:hypothetical protein NQ315_000927 [Exocentrus adspersus]